jgi:hypothetical protein
MVAINDAQFLAGERERMSAVVDFGFTTTKFVLVFN